MKTTQKPKKSAREPRIPVQVPEAWHALAGRLAATAKQPMLWYLESLLADKAKEAGLPHPTLPWEA